MTSLHRTHLFLAGTCLLFATGGSPAAQAPATPVGAETRPAESRPAPLPPGIDAQSLDTSISTGELRGLLIERFGLSQPGRTILEQLVQRKVVAELAAKAGYEPTAADVEQRIAELDAAARAEGASGGIADHLRRNRLELDFFRSMLRLGLQQEALTRAALGLPADAQLSSAQQDTWLEQQMQKRGIEVLPRPWKDLVATSGAALISRDEYGDALRRELPIGDVAEACFQAILQLRLETRLDAAARARVEPEIDRALARRRTELERNPKYKGLTWDQYLQSQGFDEASFRRDPAVRIEALSHALTDAKLAAAAGGDAEAGLRAAYEQEREAFEERFGAAIRARMIYLAGKSYFKLLRAQDKETPDKQLFERAIVDAVADLRRIAGSIKSEDDFKKHAGLVNEEEGLKRVEGELGWIARGDPRVATEVRTAIWANAPAPSEDTTAGKLVGPLELPGGAALLWIGAPRPTPEWPELKLRVHGELRRRLIEELVPKRSLRTFLDNPSVN